VAVERSRNPGFREGDYVFVTAATGGAFIAVTSQGPQQARSHEAPLSTALGGLGHAGLTAYVGLARSVGRSAARRVVVSAASVALATVAVSFAGAPARERRIAGAPTILYFEGDLGFDGCIDHRSADLRAALAAPVRRAIYFIGKCRRCGTHAVFQRLKIRPHGDVRHGLGIQRMSSRAVSQF